MKETYAEVPISEIVENRDLQYRVSPYNLGTLVESLANEGQQVPVLLRKRQDGRLELLAGYRRLAALRQLKKQKVKARIVAEISDEEAMRIALLENLERQDLTPWDQASAAARLRKRGLSNAAIAKAFGGISVRTVQRFLVVAKAPKDFQQALMASHITIQQAFEALSRGIPLSEVKKPGQSVRLLRQMARSEKSKRADVIFRHTRNGGIHFRLTYRPRQSDPDEAIQTVIKLLSKLREMRESDLQDSQRPKE